MKLSKASMIVVSILLIIAALYTFVWEYLPYTTVNISSADLSVKSVSFLDDKASFEETDFLSFGYFTGAGLDGTMYVGSTICYYDSPGGSVVYTVQPGEYRVLAVTEGQGVIGDRTHGYYGYGYRTWPTYRQGWRYARPFQALHATESVPFYYVRLSDISCNLRKNTATAYMDRLGKNFSLLSTVKFVPFICDYYLYQEFGFVSDDMRPHPGFPLAICAVLTLALAAIIIQRKRRKGQLQKDNIDL